MILSRKFSEIWYLIHIWKWNQIVCRRIRCPIRVGVDFGFYPKLVSYYFSNLIGPISIDILPMGWLWIWHLLIHFHVSLRHTICMEHGVDCLTTKLLSKIHRLVRQPLILEPGVDLALLKPYSLMILLGICGKTCCPVHPPLAFIGIDPADVW